MENNTEKKPSVLNVTIQDTQFRIEGNTTYCDMLVKVNLKSFEEQFYHFTPTFVKKVIGEHLPIIKSVINYGYSELEPVVAKYYILPGGPVKVLAFNKKYYKQFYGFDETEVLNVGDIIPLKDMVKVGCECVQYDYCQTFTVTGKAVCLPEDEFNEDYGKHLASCKACEKITLRVKSLFKVINDKVIKMQEAVKDNYDIACEWSNKIDDLKKAYQNSETE